MNPSIRKPSERQHKVCSYLNRQYQR